MRLLSLELHVLYDGPPNKGQFGDKIKFRYLCSLQGECIFQEGQNALHHVYNETSLIQHSIGLGKNVRLEGCWVTESLSDS